MSADRPQERSAPDVAEDLASPDRPMVTDGFDIPDLGVEEDAPPAYGDHHDQLQFRQAGFEAGAAVTEDGRVNINISQSNRRLSDFLASALRSQLLPQEKAPGPLPPAYIPPGLGGAPGQAPPPRLNVVIQIVGSRGDVQPFVALGKVLKDTYGHRVRLATHPTFQKFVEENGLEFFNIGGDPAELMAFMVKNPGLMPGLDALKSGEIKKRREGIEEILLGCWRSCIEAGNGLGPPPKPHRRNEPLDESFSLPGNPADRPFVADAIIANPPSFAHIHVAEKLGIPLHMMFTMPWSPTRAFPHPLANIQSTNTDVVMTNYISYALVEMMTWQGLGDVINRFRDKALDLEPLSLIWAPGVLTRLRIPTTYCWSPALIPKPNDWAREISIPGFYFLDLATSYTPEPDLAAFLESGPPPVYIGFGSIVVDDPNHLTRLIFDAVSIAGVRALVSKGWGGIGADSVGIPDGVFMLGNCPHDWLFRHVSAVVHHGGAGTNAAGIKLGKPTVVVPFFGDQPFWGSMIARAGAGPEPIPYRDLTAEKLAEAIQSALKPETQARARELGERIREERGTDMGGTRFHQFLNVDGLRCSLAPSRVAVWRVRRTQLRLSALAGAVLVREGILKYSDLKLYRSTEYQTEDQPWDPISAVAAALMGDISGLTMAVADFPRDMFKAKKKAPGAEGTASSGEESAKQSSTAEPVLAVSDAADAGPSSHGQGASSEQPSVTTNHVPGASTGSVATDVLGSSRATTTLSPSPAGLSPRGPHSPARPPMLPPRDGSSPAQFDIETAVGAGKSVSRIVSTGMKTPMNFCLGLARGFRNAPRLYHDETVRRPEKVTDFASGVRVASKEFGLGFYDGLSGLVTQPLKGAEKEGGMGLLKGFGKGVGGLVLKPAAAFWSVPAYTMQGVHAEVRSFFARSVQNYIITSRVLQGQEDLASSTPEERQDIVLRWDINKKDLKGSYHMSQQKEKQAEKQHAPETSAASGNAELDNPPPKTGWIHTRHLSLDERKRLHAQKGAWKERQAEAKVAAAPTDALDEMGENDEFEHAIRASVVQTSWGNADEDVEIEKAIRASVSEMRKIAEYGRDWKERQPVSDPEPNSEAGPVELPGSAAGRTGGDITDEEYRALVEEAVRRSLMSQPSGVRSHPASGEEGEYEDKGNSDPSTTIEESKSHPHPPDLHDHDLRLAMEESEQAHQEQLQRDSAARDEEDIVMEYVKKQSLAEEGFRRSKAKGKGVSQGTGGNDEDDEELKRALEESLKMSHGGDGGPSSLS